MLKFFYSLVIFATPFALLEGRDAARMLQDLDVIKSAFETKYAPYEWKKSCFGWSLEEEINIAKIKIITLNSLTVKDYQRILHAFFRSMRDYHVQDYYYSTEIALLPFEIKSANNKYYFTDINVSTLSKMKELGDFKGEKFPEIGNELITFDSQAITSVIEDLKFQELGDPTSRTTQTLAEKILTKRFGSFGHSVPQGAMIMSFKTADGSVIESELNWIHIPEEIRNHSYTMAMTTFGKNSLDFFEKAAASSAKNKKGLQSHKMLNHLAETLQKDYSTLIDKHIEPSLKKFQQNGSNEKEENQELEEENNEKPISLAVTRDNITFGQQLWKESEETPFRAHIYQLPGTDKKIGYIRIKTYSPPMDENEVNQLVLNLANSLHEFQLITDALLVDQVDNPGGELFHALAIVSLLTDRPLIAPKNRLALTQDEIATALKSLPPLHKKIKKLEKFEQEFPGITPPYKTSSFVFGFPLDLNFMKNLSAFHEFLITEWDEGKTLTSAFPICGIEALHPHPLSQYSKPILILVNSFSFSCADLVPAILQDNGRAIVFGEQTAGAGGAVETHQYPNSFGLAKFSYTVSLIERVNGALLENLGVTPDVPYNLTEHDLLNGYTEYIDAVNQTLEQMIQ